MKVIDKNKAVILSFIFFCCSLFSQSEGGIGSVNVSAAVAALQDAAALYTDGKFEQALFQAQLGSVYDPNTADFLYLEALCALKLKRPLAEVLEKSEAACADGLLWRFYDVNAARLLAAKANYRMRRYNEALRLIRLLPFSSADSDYIRAASFYGLGRDGDARSVISGAMSRWALDPRFPKLFFFRETGKKITASGRGLANHILSRLYAWQEQDPSLLVFASPFESKSEENIRRLKIYRSMYMPFNGTYEPEALYNHAYSTLLCLHYGIIDEQTAVDEFLNMKSYYHNPLLNKTVLVHTMYEKHLVELLKSVGNPSVREQIRSFLQLYEGLVLDDANNDMIADSAVYYKNGRPLTGEFDISQDGYPDYIIECDFGIPRTIYGKKKAYTAVYDQYPSLKTFTQGETMYALRPLDLKWAPVSLKELNLRLFDSEERFEAFFTLHLEKTVQALRENVLVHSCIYREQPDPALTGAVKKVFFDKGLAVTDEVSIDGKIYSAANYKNGLIALENIDQDGDGYFETRVEYNTKDALKTISIDLNKNKLYEYTERYASDSSVTKTWDDNEDGKSEIAYVRYSNGNSKTEWLHPKTNAKVTVTYVKDEPFELYTGNKKEKLIPSGKGPVYWLKKAPDLPAKVNEKIIEIFNQKEVPVVSYVFTINATEVYAIKSGGYIFAEIIRE